MEETRRDIEIRLKKREAGICAGRAQFAEKDDRWTILHGPRISPHLKMKPLAGPSAGDSAGLNIPDLLKQAVDSMREFAIKNFSRVNPPRRGALSPLSDAQSAPVPAWPQHLKPHSRRLDNVRRISRTRLSHRIPEGRSRVGDADTVALLERV